MKVNDQIPTPLVISKKWHLRPNHGAGILYRFSNSESKLLRLSAHETVALALFDGNRSLSDVINLVSRLLRIDRHCADKKLEHLMARNKEHGPFLIPVDTADTGFTRVNTSRILMEIAFYKPSTSKALRMQAPLSLLVIPTYKCQTDCIYCYAERPELSADSIMSCDRWLEILMEAGELGVDLITFSGGDPLTYPSIDQLLKVAHRYRMAFLLPTKTLISKRRAKKLAELITEQSEIQISVDSIDPDVAEEMTQLKGYADRARKSLINLLDAGLPVRSNTVVTPLNLGGIEALVRELFLLGVRRANITNYGRSHYRHNDSLFLSQEQIDFLHTTVNRVKKELDWPELNCNAGIRDFSKTSSRSQDSWDNRAGCSGGFSSFVVLPNGDVVLCEQVPHDERFVVGNLKQQSIMDVWNSPELIDFIVPDQSRFKGYACGDCEEFDDCHRIHGRCFRDAFFNTGQVFAPSPNCPLSSPGLRMS